MDSNLEVGSGLSANFRAASMEAKLVRSAKSSLVLIFRHKGYDLTLIHSKTTHPSRRAFNLQNLAELLIFMLWSIYIIVESG